MGSQPGGGHKSPMVDWIAVYVMLLGCIGLALAMPLKNWWIALAGAIVLLGGVITALSYGIMNHTEDYELHPRRTGIAAEPSEGQRPHRIISA